MIHQFNDLSNKHSNLGKKKGKQWPHESNWGYLGNWSLKVRASCQKSNGNQKSVIFS